MRDQKCPICRRKVVKPNVWVIYHIRYSPPLTLLACKYCNFVENCIRNGKPIPFNHRNPYRVNQRSRAEMVVAFHEKVGVKLGVRTCNNVLLL